MEKTPEQVLASAHITQLGNDILDGAQDMCACAQTGDVYFVPVVIVAAVLDGEPPSLIASNCVFPSGEPIQEVSKLLDMTAKHLVGDVDEDGLIVERHLVHGEKQ